jgi:hypothetical protein
LRWWRPRFATPPKLKRPIAKLGREPGGGLIVAPDAFTVVHQYVCKIQAGLATPFWLILSLVVQGNNAFSFSFLNNLGENRPMACRASQKKSRARRAIVGGPVRTELLCRRHFCDKALVWLEGFSCQIRIELA